MADIEKVIQGLDQLKSQCDKCPFWNGNPLESSDYCTAELVREALELLKVYKEKIESESEKTTLIDEALEVGRCVLRRGIYIPGSGKQWIRVSMTIKEAEKIFGTMRQMKDKQT